MTASTASSPTPTATAARTDTRPAAIGRCRLTGWRRSRSRSAMSLPTYTTDDARMNTATAAASRPSAGGDHAAGSTSASGTTSRLFTHWCGRSSASRSRGDPRCPGTGRAAAGRSREVPDTLPPPGQKNTFERASTPCFHGSLLVRPAPRPAADPRLRRHHSNVARMASRLDCFGENPSRSRALSMLTYES